ncbi:TPA: hypothetical protein EYQ19_02555 [Candidatus Pacearchaeota archaeon]|jgi:hypothetical protein|nr:hypothetical protein [Candidatus Pacearchaeota archaeon]
MNKRGQFYIIAAVIVVGIVVGLSSTVNSAVVGGEREQFYDLADEINYETKQVIDYGVFNSLEIDNLLIGFLGKYADYISKEQVLFLVGDSEVVTAYSFIEQNVGSFGLISTDPSSYSSITIQEIGSVTAYVSLDPDLGIVTATVEGIDYIFNLEEGENFFFVIIQTEEEERFVAQR